MEVAGIINHTIFHQNMHPQVFHFPTTKKLPHFVFVISLVRWRGKNDQFYCSDPHQVGKADEDDRRRLKRWGTSQTSNVGRCRSRTVPCSGSLGPRRIPQAHVSSALQIRTGSPLGQKYFCSVRGRLTNHKRLSNKRRDKYDNYAEVGATTDGGLCQLSVESATWALLNEMEGIFSQLRRTNDCNSSFSAASSVPLLTRYEVTMNVSHLTRTYKLTVPSSSCRSWPYRPHGNLICSF
jgi:hypothetical protein